MINLKFLLDKCTQAGGLATIAIAGWLVMASAGIPVPTPAWSSDIARIEGSIGELTRIVIIGQLNDAKAQWDLVKGQIDDYRARKMPVPAAMMSRKNAIETQIEILREQLRK